MNAAALTGGIASGKSAAAAFIQSRGIAVFDTDHAAAELTRVNGGAIPRLVETFGSGCLDAQGALDRAAMRERVFSDPKEKRRLEAILHPMIRSAVDAFLTAQANRRCVVLIPLLFESLSYRGVFRETACIDCPTQLQVLRLVKHRRMDEALARRIVESQVPRAIRLQLADRVFSNAGELPALERQLEAWLGDWPEVAQ